MKKIIFSLLLITFAGVAFAQTPRKLSKSNSSLNKSDQALQDSLSQGNVIKSKGVKNLDAKIIDYLIITNQRDTIYLDTTLTINKEYKFNYLRQDNFGLMPFANVGQSYNRLTYNFENTNLIPGFGAKAKHFNYMDADDINSFHVPTPLTELYFKTAFTQGQQLDAFFTTNTSRQLNMSIGYKGLRSLGFYQNSLTSTGNLRIRASYKTKNKRYVVNTHFTSQDFSNQENGGLTDSNIDFFESGDEDFLDRGVLEVNFQDAENLLLGKRFYLNQSYDVLRPKDSISSNKIQLAHVMMLEDKIYTYDQTSANTDYFGEAFQTSNIKDRTELEQFTNQLQLNYSNATIGNLQFNATHNNYNYGYDRIVFINQNVIPNRLKGDILSIGGKYNKNYKGFNLNGEAGLNVSGDFEGNFISGTAAYQLNKDIKVSANINHSSVAPDFNTLLYQSDYKNYNWRNQFNNIKTQQIVIKLQSNKYANITLDLSTINDYVYFAKDQDQAVRAFQNKEAITYLKLKLQKEIRYNNFALDNTILYQTVQDNSNSLNVPQLVTRNTFYYSNHVFKKAMFLQTGIIFNYFTAYNMDGYDPLLSEFYTQNQQELGGFPRLDFFINAKIRQTRIFLKAEHFNAAFTGRNYYSAPNQPFRDFTVRFGLVWNFFL
ncbi:putative porin [Olleya aquimaris]|uniref:Putative beta-barrel porin n=1 Tax=Olleya aquimaris TaxID=639310 RepID=A0A327RGX9_9FLAO|nr:putative porin [Olleya aquimaris]RAJ15232.1 putative beta-barrel porin [Olleya aquimaris]